MYELNVKTRRDLERATLRAQAQKPRIEEVAFGMYKVWSTNPETPWIYYSTGIEAAPVREGGYSVCCSCPTTRFLCKHVAAAFPHFLMREKEYNQPTEAASEAAPVYTAEMEARDRSDLFG
jgi:hypothetical protein